MSLKKAPETCGWAALTEKCNKDFKTIISSTSQCLRRVA